MFTESSYVPGLPGGVLGQIDVFCKSFLRELEPTPSSTCPVTEYLNAGILASGGRDVPGVQESASSFLH